MKVFERKRPRKGKFLTFVVEEEFDRTLQRIAVIEGVSRSEVIRALLRLGEERYQSFNQLPGEK